MLTAWIVLGILNYIGIESKFLTEADKNGIHELSENAPVGENPIKYMELDDAVIDFDLTANRGDLLSMLGMAYEVGAIYGEKVKDIDLSYKEEGNIDFVLFTDSGENKNLKYWNKKKIP